MFIESVKFKMNLKKIADVDDFSKREGKKKQASMNSTTLRKRGKE